MEQFSLPPTLSFTEPRKKVAVLLSVFADESHDERSARVFAVAGLFGSEEEWKRTKDVWVARTEGTIFHAADCESGHGAFAQNSQTENLRLYRDLSRIISDSRLMGFGCAMDVAGYNRVFPETERNIPYYRCFVEVVMYFAQLGYQSIEQTKVKFTFDHRIGVEYNAAALYQFVSDLPEWNYGALLFDEISFASSARPEIQMADLIARETMKHLDNQIGPVPRPTRLSMRALFDSGRFHVRLLMGEDFESFRSNHEAGMAQWVEEYGAWLSRNNIVDSFTSRQRYSMQVDIPKFISRRKSRTSDALVDES